MILTLMDILAISLMTGVVVMLLSYSLALIKTKKDASYESELMESIQQAFKDAEVILVDEEGNELESSSASKSFKSDAKNKKEIH